MAKIEDLLHRRTDLSTFLVHFTRTHGGRSAKQRLTSILWEDRIRASTPMGMAAKFALEVQGDRPRFFRSQCVVSLTETPLEHAWMMCHEIEARQHEFAPYGIAFTKAWGRSKGINPVWYLDISRRGIDWLTKPVNAMVTAAVEAGDYRHEIFKLAPYMEQMGPIGGGRVKEFWWEREWRLAGSDLQFRPRDVVAVLAPARYHESIASDLEDLCIEDGVDPDYYGDLHYIDPTWGLERIIARLANVPDEEAGPYPQY